MEVTIYSHNFAVRGYNRYGYEFLKKFGVNNFGEVDFRAIRINKMPSRFRKKPLPTIKRTYAACTADGREFRFHRNTLELFKEAVSNEPELCDNITYTEEPMYAPEHVGLKVLPKWTPRDNQIPLIGYFNSPGSTKILNLMTGGGKTYCSLESSAHYGERLTICIESRFFNLWAEALDPDSDKQVLDLKKEEILWIQGSKDLKALLQLALTNQLDGIKVIVIALRTMANYIETYTRFGEDMLTLYPVLPIDFYKVTKTGTALKDEVHLSLYANYMEELFSHVPRRFSLSATLEDGSFKDKIFGIMFPMDQRFDAGPLKQYIAVTALKYRLREPSQVKYSVRGSSDYNHNAFEQWIMADRKRLNNYLKLILNWVDRRFVSQSYFEGQKSVVFVSSIEMATEVWKYLKKNIPQWTVSRYAASAGDVYDDSKQADIMITTEKSFSTGFDLPGLVCALLTVSINSFNTNVQILGRLRELRDHPEITPIFDYLVCEDIQRHIDYHEEKKRTIFKDRVKSHKTKYVNIVV